MKTSRDYIGARGLASKTLYDELPRGRIIRSCNLLIFGRSPDGDGGHLRKPLQRGDQVTLDGSHRCVQLWRVPPGGD